MAARWSDGCWLGFNTRTGEHTAIEGTVIKDNEHFDEQVMRALGCDVSGAPWGIWTYGETRISRGRHEDLERVWAMIGSLHALRRAGWWRLAAGVAPDWAALVRRPSRTPAEAAATAAFLKE